MLVTGATLKGQKPENEQIVVYAHKLDESRTINSAGLEHLTEEIYADSLIRLTHELRKVTNYSVAKPRVLGGAIELIGQLERDPRYKNLEFRMIRKRRGYYVVASGLQSELKNLPEHFTLNIGRDHSSRAWIERQLKKPFSRLERTEHDGQLYVASGLTMDEFCRLKTISLDSEFEFYQHESNIPITLEGLRNTTQDIIKFLAEVGESTETASIGINREDLIARVENHFNSGLGIRYVKQPTSIQIGESVDGMNHIHYFEYISGRTGERDIALATGTTRFHGYKGENAVDMMRQFQQFLDENPFLLMITQNGMTYDLRQLRWFVEEENKRQKAKGNPKVLDPFTIFGFSPVQEGPGGFYKKVVIPAIYHIDTAPYSQNYFPWTQDNKFGTIAALILGKPVAKTQGYDDLTRMNIEQIIATAAGNLEAAEEFAEPGRVYGSEDVTVLNAIARYLKQAVYLKCQLFGRNPDDICVTSRRTLAKTEYEFRVAEEHLEPIHWKRETTMKYNEISSADEFTKLLDPETVKGLRKSTDVGFREGALYYLAPFTRIFRNELRENRAVKQIFEYIESLNIDPDESSTQSTLARVDLINTIEDGYLLPYILIESMRGFVSHKGSIESRIAKFNALVDNFKPINASGNFYCFPTEVTRTPEFHEAMSGLGFKVAEGQLLSIDAGSFVLHDRVTLYKREVDIKGIRGFKSIYQKEATREIIRFVFEEGPETAIRYFATVIDGIRQGRIDRDKLIHFNENITRDYFDYSSYAQRQERVKAYIAFSMQKGQEFAKMRLADGWHNLEDFLQMPHEHAFSPENIEYLISEYLGPKRNKRQKTSAKQPNQKESLELPLFSEIEETFVSQPDEATDYPGRNLKVGKLGKFIRPLLALYDIPEKQAIYCIEHNDLEPLFATKKQT